MNIKYKIPIKDHKRMIAHAIKLVKLRESAKWKICSIATKVCYVGDKFGEKSPKYKNCYSITNFAEEIGMNRKTLSCWILDYMAVYKKITKPNQVSSLAEMRKINSAISQTRVELYDFNFDSKKEAISMPKEVVQKRFDEIMSVDVLNKRLMSFIKNLQHHAYTFANEKFNETQEALIENYLSKSLDIQSQICKILDKMGGGYSSNKTKEEVFQ